MNEKNNPLIQGAGPSPSSDTVAATQTLGAESAPLNAEAQIPENYPQNRLVLLPVNAHTQHFYWELSDEALLIRLSNREAALEVKLYYIDPDRRREIERISLNAPRGNYYTYHTPNLQQMEAALYVVDETGAQELLVSNRITGPSSGMHASPWEIWMTKKGSAQKLESRPSDLVPTPDALVNPSSLDLVLRAEELRARMGDMGLTNPSSDFASRHLFSSDETAKGSR